MKAKDVKINTEYLSCVTRDWRTNTYTGHGYGATRRVRVLDPVPGYWEWSEVRDTYVKAPKGYRSVQGVLVANLHVDSGDHLGNQVVALATLRGPWEPTWTEVKQAYKVASVRRREEQDAREALSARVLAALEVIEYRTGLNRGLYRCDDSRAIVHVEVLEAIGALLEDGK